MREFFEDFSGEVAELTRRLEALQEGGGELADLLDPDELAGITDPAELVRRHQAAVRLTQGRGG